MWLKLSTFSAFPATMEMIFFLKVFKRKKEKKCKNKKKDQDPRRDFSEHMHSDSRPSEPCALPGGSRGGSVSSLSNLRGCYL